MKNTLEEFYEKPAKDAKFLSKEDFLKSMRWWIFITAAIGLALMGIGGLSVTGVVNVPKAPAFAATGLFFCICAGLSRAFPGFRRFYDGGTIHDIYMREAIDLSAAWADQLPDVTASQLSIDDPFFWGTTNAVACIILVDYKPSDAGGHRCFLAAHCDKHRKGKSHPLLGKGKCVALRQVFCGSLETLVEQLRELNEQSLASMRQAIDDDAKMKLDPLLYSPFSGMLCPRA
ncbi:MAG: hypothetical protein AAF750_15425 [Planctomycetota bacterium]